MPVVEKRPRPCPDPKFTVSVWTEVSLFFALKTWCSMPGLKPLKNVQCCLSSRKKEDFNRRHTISISRIEI